MGRDLILQIFHVYLFNVSIHAPAWGATVGHSLDDTIWCVSIHAPAWGATPFYKPLQLFKRVSIHAPAWGATRFI